MDIGHNWSRLLYNLLVTGNDHKTQPNEYTDKIMFPLTYIIISHVDVNRKSLNSSNSFYG